MKITHVTIDHLIGIEGIDIELPAPVAVFAGRNGVGKSSVREAIRAAFLTMPERVLKKKDLGQLVHGDAKHGAIGLDFDHGQATFTAPSGKQEITHDFTMAEWRPQELALPYCLDPAMFARGSADERRSLLFALTGASSKPEDIVAAMRERGLAEAVIEAVTPMLRAGFPGMAKLAEERCRDAKAGWKAVTGETYGHVKAEPWAAPAGEPVDEAAIQKLQALVDGLRHRIENGRTELGAAEQKLKTWLQAEDQHAADEKLAGRLEAAQAKLAHDEAEYAQWADQVQQLEQRAGTGPRVGLVHDLAAWLLVTTEHIHQHGPELKPDENEGIEKVIDLYEQQHGEIGAQADPEAAEKLPKARQARDLMGRCVDNDRRDIDAARAAAARLEQPVERGSQDEVDYIREFLRAAEDELAAATADLAKLQANQRAAAQAQSRTERARAAHQDVQAWQVAIDALSPAGIPADVLGKSLGPLNLALANICRTLNFPRVEIIDADIGIYLGGRPYALLSGSERWRADAQIALSLADLSGLRFVALDQFDILDLPGRSDCIVGLDALAGAGRIDTALVFGTFKKLPNLTSLQHVTGWWIEGGRIAQTAAAVDQAAPVPAEA